MKAAIHTVARAALGLALASGCSFPEPSETYRCDVTADCESGRVCEQGFCVVSNGVDAAPDTGGSDAGIDCTSWPAPRHFMPCELPAPSAALVLETAGEYVYDTTTGMLTGPTSAQIASKVVAAGRAISVERLSIGPSTTLRVTGMHPLIVASWSTIEIRGKLDAGSGTARGAGANPTECSTHAATAAQDDNDGASGGGGGGFQGAGGRGGLGDEGNAGLGGGAVPMPLLLGGCSGNRGGNTQGPGGAGGDGGGAVQLTARTSISIAGQVLAGGAGGLGAPTDAAGGGGGGSGGMIGLESPSVTVASGAALAAKGGGGGQASNTQPGGPGQSGASGSDTGAPAAGGTGGDGAPGGAGSGGASLTGSTGGNSSADGGGGGGGGAGYIAIKAGSRQLDAGAKISPTATILP